MCLHTACDNVDIIIRKFVKPLPWDHNRPDLWRKYLYLSKMSASPYLWVIFSLPCTAIQWVECPAAGNIRYLRLQSKLSWGQARDACSRIVPGSHLATPRSADQSGCVHFARNGDSSSHWIGIRSFDAGQSYVYIDNNQPIGPYTNWTANEPRLQTGYLCGQIWSFNGEYGWDNNRCGLLRSSICQRAGVCVRACVRACVRVWRVCERVFASARMLVSM